MIVGIIGTAGRKEDGPKLNKNIYCNIVRNAKLKLEEINCDIDLVSGGAAWADHVAVSLFLMKLPYIKSLTIHAPCKFINNQYDEENKYGGIANYYHRKFSNRLSRCETKTLEGIGKALSLGAKLTISNGFFERNKLVAQSEYLIAYTFGIGDIPKDGGTKHTWDLCEGRKIHISITNLT